MESTDFFNRFFKNGHLQTIPKKFEDKQFLFTYLQKELATRGTCFTEKEINDFLMEYYHDYALVRRYLVDFAYLVRDDYGRQYHLPEDYISKR